MKPLSLTAMLCIMLCCNLFANSYILDKTTFNGTIKDSKTNEPLPGVSLYIIELKTGTITDADGKFNLNNIPNRKFTVQISLLGYQTLLQQIDLAVKSTYDFKLQTTLKEINEVVITGNSNPKERNRTATPIHIITKPLLQQAVSTNIIDALANQPGISQVSTGAGISKPVIRGLGYNRVVVVNDEIRQEGQQWGDEHGIEIDEYSIGRIEILKGPGSLMYGSDAMAGVMHFISDPVLPEGTMNTSFISNYQTNNGLIGNSLNSSGNKNGFIWNLRYSNKMAHAYKNKFDGYVANSGFRENAISGTIGLNKSWGYSHLTVSSYNIKPGIPEGERDSLTGQFLLPDAENGERIATESDNLSYSSLIPYQSIRHNKIVLNNSFILKESTLKTTFGYQQNIRKEFEDVSKPNEAELHFDLKTFNYDVRLILPQNNKWNTSIGLNGMLQHSQNKGDEFLIPAYDIFDAGIYAITSRNFGKLDVSGGIRYDQRNFKSAQLIIDDVVPEEEKFAASDKTFSGISGSLGATYQFSDKFYSKLNLSRGYRAPNIAELKSNGVHEGTIRYEIGNPNLKPEFSWQVDYSIGFNSDHVTIEADVFNNFFNSFIFIRKLSAVNGQDSIREDNPVFVFDSEKARQFGGELMIDIHPHPLDWLHFQNSFSFVESRSYSNEPGQKFLPFTPAPKLTSEIRMTANKINSIFSNGFFRVGLDTWFRQDQVFSAFETETPTNGYSLLSVGLGADVMTKSKKKLFTFIISGSNLTDEAYQSHLSRLKYAPINYQTGRQGIFNQGRNFSFKLIFNLDSRI